MNIHVELASLGKKKKKQTNTNKTVQKQQNHFYICSETQNQIKHALLNYYYLLAQMHKHFSS